MGEGNKREEKERGEGKETTREGGGGSRAKENKTHNFRTIRSYITMQNRCTQLSTLYCKVPLCYSTCVLCMHSHTIGS